MYQRVLDNSHMGLGIMAMSGDDHRSSGVAIDQQHHKLAGAVASAVIGACTVAVRPQRRPEIETADDPQVTLDESGNYGLGDGFAVSVNKDTVIHGVYLCL